ncbi:MAG: response regulator [Bdellovibrio sp.]|nr:response regulator [Bdellovibrio sp.]
MVPLTALLIITLSLSNAIIKLDQFKFISRLPAFFVVIVTTSILVRFLFSDLLQIGTYDFKLIRLTSPQSCMAILVMALGHLLYSAKTFLHSSSRSLFQALNITALTISALAGLGYVYSITTLFGLSQYVGMSIPTAVSVFFLALLSLRLDPDYGVVRAFSQKNSAGFFFRHFLLGSLVAPFVIAGLIRWAETHKELNSTYGMAAFVFFTLCSTLILGIATARSLERVEKQKIKLNLQAVEASKANEGGKLRDKFLANMSHEVRTPLTAILGYLDFIDEPSIKNEDRLDFTRRAKRSAKTLLRVLDDILDLSKVGADRLKVTNTTFSILELAQDVVSQYYLQAKEKDLIFELKIMNEIPDRIIADANRIQQILTNLVSNAVKFTEKGYVRIWIAFRPGTNSLRSWLAIDVSDTGIGIPRDAQSHLFQSFYQVDDSITRKFGGSGIGLALSENLAQLMGGRLFLKASKLNIGSVFCLSLPCEPAPNPNPAPPAPEQNKKKDSSLAGLNILLVDDNIDNQFLISHYLLNAGALVETAENGQVGVSSALAGTYSLILMDIQMPIMDGLNATRLLRQNGFRAPIIALSAHASDEHRKASLGAGCNAHTVKPIEKAELIRVIHGCLEKSKELTP